MWHYDAKTLGEIAANAVIVLGMALWTGSSLMSRWRERRGAAPPGRSLPSRARVRVQRIAPDGSRGPSEVWEIEVLETQR